MRTAPQKALFWVSVLVILACSYTDTFYAGALSTPVAYAAPVQLPKDNATYCEIWRETNEPVAGADKKEMQALCKGI